MIMRWRITFFVMSMILLGLLTNISWHFASNVSAKTDINGPEAWGLWTVSNSPYFINNNITIPYGKTLTIEPGVEVIANGSYQILVGGILFANGTFENNINFTSIDIYSTEFDWLGIKFNTTGTGTIKNCTVRNASYGILTDNSRDVKIENSTFKYNLYSIFIDNNSHNILITKCEFVTNYYGIYICNSNNNFIINCTIHQNYFNGLGLSISNSSYNIINGVWTEEDMDFSDNSNFNTIKNSYFDDSYGTSQVQFYNGTRSNIIINSRFYSDFLIMDNFNSNFTILDSFFYNEIDIYYSSLITFFHTALRNFADVSTFVDIYNSEFIEFKHCNIQTVKGFFKLRNASKFEIANCYLTPYYYSSNFMNNIDPNKTSNNDPRVDYYGIEMSYGTNNITIRNSEIIGYTQIYGLMSRDCWDFTILNSNFSTFDDGYNIVNCDKFLIHNNRITNCNNGMYIKSCTDFKINSSYFYLNQGYGIFSEYNSEFQIQNCLIEDCDDSGINLLRSSFVNISNNIIRDSNDHGCIIDFSNNIIIQNSDFYSNSQYGLNIFQSNDILISNCEIKNNAIFGIYSGNSEKISIYDTRIEFNDEDGIRLFNSELYFENCGIKRNEVELSLSHYSTAYLINCGFDDQFVLDSSTEKIYVGWFVSVTIKDLTGKFVNNAIVRVSANNTTSENASVFKTNSKGRVNRIICFEYARTKYDTYNYNPYTITAQKSGSGVSSKLVNVTSPQNLTMILKQIDLKPTSLTFSWTKNYIPLYERFNITFEIENSGDSIVRDIEVRLDVKGSSYNNTVTTEIEILEPNSKVSDNFEYPPIYTTGNYNVTLIVDSNNQIFETNEQNNELTKTITITSRPVAILRANKTYVYVNESVMFYANESFGAVAILEYIFNFGDGSNEITLKTNNKIEHKFEKSGTYKVTLIVKDINGLQSNPDIIYISVNRRPGSSSGEVPTANFIINPTTGDIQTSFSFDPSSSLPSKGAEILSYNWYFGDGETSIWKKPIHKYEDDGIYIVGLKIKDSKGLWSDTYNRTLIVKNQKPVAVLRPSNKEAKIGEIIAFYSDDSYDIDDTLSEPGCRFTWYFGDSKNSNYTESSINYPDGSFDKITTFIYSQPGNYTVTLVVVDDDQARDQTSIEIRILPATNGPKDNVTEAKDDWASLIIISICLIIIIIIIVFVIFYRRKKRSQISNEQKTRLAMGGSLEVQPTPTTTDYSGVTSYGGTDEKGIDTDTAQEDIDSKEYKTKKKKEKDKILSQQKKTYSYQPPAVEVTLPEEKVIDWKDEVSANGHVLSLSEVSIISDKELLSASMIGINGKKGEMPEVVLEDEEAPVEWSETGEEFEELEEEIKEIPVEEIMAEDFEEEEPDETLVFEFEDHGETISEQLEATHETVVTLDEQKYKTKSKPKHRKDDLIPIPGIGFVKRSELRKAVGMEDEIYEGEYEDIPIPDGMPLKLDDTGIEDAGLKCKWCDKPIKGKYIKFRRKEKDGTKLAIVGPFCSPQCASKFGK